MKLFSAFAALLLIASPLAAQNNLSVRDLKAYGDDSDATTYALLSDDKITFADTGATNGVLTWDVAGTEFEFDNDVKLTAGGFWIGASQIIDSSRNFGNIANSTGSTNVVFSDTPTLATPNWTGTATGVGLTLTGDLDIDNDTGTGDFVRATNPALGGTADVNFYLDADNAGASASSIALLFNRGITGEDVALRWNHADTEFEFLNSPSLAMQAVQMGALTATSGTFSSSLSATNLTLTDAADVLSLSIDGTEVIDDGRNATFASMASTGAVSGTTGTFTGNLTMSGAARRVLLREWDGVAGNEGRIVFDGSDDADTYLGASGTDSVTQVINGAKVIRYTQFYVRNETGSTQMQWSAGSASAPAYSKNGDTNTGIFFSGADAVDFATGGTRAGGFSSSQAFEVAGASITLGGVKITRGTGSPESVVTGSVGDLFLRTDGGAGSTLYVKESGSATNTGWVGK